MVEVGQVRRKRDQPAFLFEDGAVRLRDVALLSNVGP
jgi:hypothetical protein